MEKRSAGKSNGKHRGMTRPPMLATAGTMDERVSMSIRKIANGYVVSHSGEKNGKQFYRETFTPTKPMVHITPSRQKQT
jgi:hypothetical protein